MRSPGLTRPSAATAPLGGGEEGKGEEGEMEEKGRKRRKWRRSRGGEGEGEGEEEKVEEDRSLLSEHAAEPLWLLSEYCLPRPLHGAPPLTLS